MENEDKYIENVVYESILEYLDVNLNDEENFTIDTKLFEGGLEWDSLELLQAVYILEEKLDIVIDPERLKELKTVRGIIGAVKEIIKNK